MPLGDEKTRRLKAYLLYLRPKSFPVTFVFVFTGYILGPLAEKSWQTLAGDLALLGLVYSVLIWGGSNAFNSSQDRDAGPVNLMPNPPPLPKHLGTFGIACIVLGVLLSVLKGPWALLLSAIGAMTSIYYSWINPRWRRGKDIPGIDLIINAGGCGLGSVLAGFVFNTGTPSWTALWVGVAFTVAIFGGLPTSQIFQLQLEAGNPPEKNYTSSVGPARVLRIGAGLFLLHILLLGCFSVRYWSKAPLGALGFLLAWFLLVFAAAIHSWCWSRSPLEQAYPRMLRQMTLMMFSQVCWIVFALWARYRA